MKTKSITIEERCKKIARVINSITLHMSYVELEKYLYENKCPYYNTVLKNRYLFFDKKNTECKKNGKETYNYVLKEKPIYYKKIYQIFEKNQKETDEIPKKKKVFTDIVKKGYVSYPQLVEIYKNNSVENISEYINGELKSGILIFRKGVYYLSKHVGKLIDKEYEEPIILSNMSKNEKKALSKKHPKVEVRDKIYKRKEDENGNILYRIEFNQENQLFHYDDGTHEENTFGWRTVQDNVINTSIWSAFDEFRYLFKFKFSSVNHILETYRYFEEILKCYSGIKPDKQEDITVDKCLEFLKNNGFCGKLEKIETTTFNI